VVGVDAPRLDGVFEALMVGAVLIRISAGEQRNGVVKLLPIA
jgi:hypothetical protein